MIKFASPEDYQKDGFPDSDAISFGVVAQFGETRVGIIIEVINLALFASFCDLL